MAFIGPDPDATAEAEVEDVTMELSAAELVPVLLPKLIPAILASPQFASGLRTVLLNQARSMGNLFGQYGGTS